MALIKLTEFHGLSPRTDDLQLGNFSATVARNVKLRNKTLKSWKAPYSGTTLPKSGMDTATVSSIYYYPPNSGVWFHWPFDVDVVSGQHDDPETRVYFTGDDEPKYTYSTIAGTTGSQAPTNSWTLGLPAPGVLTSGIPSGTSSGAENEVTSAWIYTWVTGKGEEGPPSTASNSQTFDPTAQTVQLTGFTAAPATGTHSIDKQRLYRLVTSSSGTTSYQLVGERTTSASAWDDATNPDSSLGEEIPSTNWDQPDEDMIGLVALPNEFMAGFFGRTLAFSEPAYPHAWPTIYELKLDYDIVALGVFGETVVAATEGNPYLAHGVHPSSISLTKLELDQACVSKRSMVDMGSFVIYASPDGLVAVGPGTARIITEKYFTKDEWQELSPETIVGTKHDNLYVASFDNGTQQGFIIDPDETNPSFIYTDQYFVGMYNDLLTDTLYLHQYGEDSADVFDNGVNYTYTWRSKKFRAPRNRTMSCAQVFAKDYPITFRLYTDGTLRYTKVVTSERGFRLPGGERSRDFQVEIEGAEEVTQVFLATKMGELGHA